MCLDGKDHAKGKHAYDSHEFSSVWKSLDYMLNTDPDKPLTVDMIHQGRELCCNMGGFGTAHGGGKVSLRPYECLQCDHLKALIEDVPKEYLKVTKGHRCGGMFSKFNFMHKSTEQVNTMLEKALDKYYADVEKLTDKDAKLNRLASFLRNDIVFIHPWRNGNGRFRAMMTQRELRRLNIACGAFMFNNNHDIYYMTTKTYFEKLKEGIEMYDRTIATGTSAWLNQTAVQEHRAKFQIDKVMPGLMKCASIARLPGHTKEKNEKVRDVSLEHSTLSDDFTVDYEEYEDDVLEVSVEDVM